MEIYLVFDMICPIKRIQCQCHFVPGVKLNSQFEKKKNDYGLWSLQSDLISFPSAHNVRLKKSTMDYKNLICLWSLI